MNVSVPIHARYHLSSASATHATLRIAPPIIFIKSSHDDPALVCARTGMIWPQPFMVEAHLSQCPGWQKITPSYEKDPIQIDPDHVLRMRDGRLGCHHCPVIS